MSKGTSIILSAIVFGGAGFASGYYFAKNKYLKVADKEIESMKKNQVEHDKWLKDFYSKPKTKSDLKDPNFGKGDNKSLLSTVTPKNVGKNDRLEYEKKYRGVKKEGLYEKIVGDYSPTDENKVPETKVKANIDSEPELAMEIDSRIEIISTDEFDSSSNCCSTIYYYEVDGKVTDTENNIISNYTSLIGSMDFWLEEFKNSKTDVIYIRNNENDIDYEVILLHEKWEDVATPSQKALALDIGDQSNDD